MTYNLTVVVAPPFYTMHTGATTFADACTGGTTVPLIATGLSPANDEGLSAPITAPAGFTFYGAATTDFVISSNGFLSFDDTLTDSMFTPAPLPDGVGEVSIAPYWQDLENIVVCTKVVGGKTVVQWTGDEFNSGIGVQFQAILDPATGSMELLYGPNQMADGTTGAIAGVESLDGSQATETGDAAAFATANHSTLLTHP
jgi:hypothetical protein